MNFSSIELEAIEAAERCKAKDMGACPLGLPGGEQTLQSTCFRQSKEDAFTRKDRAAHALLSSSTKFTPAKEYLPTIRLSA